MSSNSTSYPEITAPSGWLSSRFLENQKGSWGREGCPWSIRVLPGQRISLILNDFTDYSSLHVATFKDQLFCPILFVVRNHVTGSSEISISSCDSKMRKRLAYLSESHQVMVYVPMETERLTTLRNMSGKDFPNFMINFQGDRSTLLNVFTFHY